MRRWLPIVVALLAVGAFGWQRWQPIVAGAPSATAAYTPSDPSRIGASELPQLVEFYHPG